MAFVEVDIDYSEFEKQLGYFSDNMPRYAKTLMGAVNAEITKKTKEEVITRGYETTKASTWGESSIYKNIFQKAKNNYTSSVGVRRDAFYAWFVENGIPNISAKNGKYLCFKADGTWHQVESVSLPAKPFMKQFVDEYWNSGEAEPIMDARLQKIINKIFKD